MIVGFSLESRVANTFEEVGELFLTVSPVCAKPGVRIGAIETIEYRELTRRSEFLRAIYNLIIDPVIIVEAETRMHSANATATEEERVGLTR